MTTRKIKDAKDVSTNELIYFRSHAKATFMSDGTSVENKINSIQIGEVDLTNYYTKDEINSNGYITGESFIGEDLDDIEIVGSQVQADWNETDENSNAYIKNKPNIHDEGDGQQFLSDDGTYKQLKTINGQSLVGSGDINIEGSPSQKPVIKLTNNIVTISPNIYYIIEVVFDSLLIILEPPTNDELLNEYVIEFTTSENNTQISLPNSIKWSGGNIPVFENNTTYQISIINNLGIWVKFV